MENDVLLFFKDNSPWFFLAYLVWKGLEPSIRLILEAVVPERIKARKTNTERLIELQEKELDIQERQVTANEQIATALVIIQNNQTHFRPDIDNIMVGIVDLKSKIGHVHGDVQILLDRNLRLRTGDKPNSISHGEEGDGE